MIRISRSSLCFLALASTLGLGAVAACGSDDSVSGSSSGDDTSASTTTAATTGTGGGGTGGDSSTSTTTSSTTSSTSGTGGSTPCPTLGDACTECLVQACPDTYCTCYDNQSCGDLVTCFQGCGADANCTQNCMSANGSGISQAFLVGDCASTSCPAQCQVQNALDPCQKCMFTSCQSQMNTCLADAECSALIQCVAACAPGDQGCQQSCGLQHIGAIGDATAVGDCKTASCAAQCG